MRLRNSWLAAVLLLGPLAAQGQPVRGFYISGGAGYNLQQSIRVTPSVPGIGSIPVQLNPSNGPRVLGSLGYGLGNGLRVEVEGDFLSNAIRAPAFTPLSTTILGRLVSTSALGRLANASTQLLRYGVLGNAFYDFDLGTPYVFPYLGAGAGYIWNDLTRSGKFAYQAIGGLSFPVHPVRGLSITAEYRFLDVTAGERYSTTITTALGSIPLRVKVGPQLDHTFLLGLRYAFSTPVPP
jgi:OmpA-OmpF porin, OOP family